MRFELKEVQARVGVTTLFVTHDQVEAMVLSDRVLVMNAGRIVQDGTPRQIYEQPRTRVRHGLPRPGRSVEARVVRRPDGAYVRACSTASRGVEVPLAADQPWQDGEGVVLAFRSARRPGGRGRGRWALAGHDRVGDVPG